MLSFFRPLLRLLPLSVLCLCALTLFGLAAPCCVADPYSVSITGSNGSTGSTTYLTSSLNPSLVGQSVTFMAMVEGSGGGPTGTVTFTIDGIAQPPVSLTSSIYYSSAAYSTSSLTGGSHTVTASYSGDGIFAPSTSQVITQMVHLTSQYVSNSGSDSNPGTMALPKLTIQAAINYTVNGDTVIVEDGTYTGLGDVDLDLGGKNVTVTSLNGPASTIIDCAGFASSDGSGNHRGFYLHSNETNATIRGFTIKNGYETYVSTIPDSIHGGGICIQNIKNNGSIGDSTITVSNCIVSANTAIIGGGIYNSNYISTIAVTNCTITGNEAGDGGGLYNSSYTSIITMTNCTVTGNTSGYGGGIENSTSANGMVTMTNCILTSNMATNGYDGQGGGLYNVNSDSGTIMVTNCTLSGNTASSTSGKSGYGGGIYNYNNNSGGMITVTNCMLRNNTAYNGDQGNGVYIGGYGGGIYNFNNYGGTITETNCVLAGNTANSAQVDNAAYDGLGGGVYSSNNSNGTITVTNCTFTGNAAPNSSGGIYNITFSSGTTAITNNILYGDTGEILNDHQSTSVVAVSFCDIQGGYAGTGNIDADPLFYNAPTDLHLQLGSPCLDVGTTSGAPTTDITGLTRPSPPSIGAYEAAVTGTTPTTTSLISSLNPSAAGQSVTFTANVVGAGSLPTGTVTFSVDGTALSHVALSNAHQAAYTTSSLTGGSHAVTASYSGDVNFAPSKSSVLTQGVTKVSSKTVLATSLNPSAYGQQINFTATVTGHNPTGIVTFTDTASATTLGTGLLANGVATFSAYALSVGSYSIKASYGGDASNNPSTSVAITQVIQKASTVITITSSLNPSIVGESVNFTAKISNSNTIPTGTVTFTVDGSTTSTIISGNSGSSGGYSSAAIYTTSSLSVGTHTIAATYNGDSNFTASTALPLMQTVKTHLSPQYVSPTGNDSNPGTMAFPKMTIQAAINATLSGDTVIVEDGTYTGLGNVDLDFGDKKLTAISQNGPASTIIDCGGSASANHRGFSLQSDAVVNGFTVENGMQSSSQGGGLYLGLGFGSASVTIQNCIFKNNTVGDGGGGIYLNGGGNDKITINNCIITGNSARFGGGIDAAGSNSGVGITITNCVLSGNSATSSGGGIYNDATNGVVTTLTNCTVTGNSAPIGGGAYIYTDSTGNTITLVNDLLYGDMGGEIQGILSGNNAIASFCDIQGGYVGTGNINADPLFVNSLTDLHLQPGSPCIGAGTVSGSPTTDITGLTRPNPPSIGAYEAVPLPMPTSLTAAAGPGSVSLHWAAPIGVTGATYSLYRSTTPGGEMFYISAGTATSFTDMAVTAGTKYYYTVKTVTASQTSAASNEASATPLAILGKVRYFPRIGQEIRMVGGLFQGSHDNATWTTLATVTAKPTDVWTEAAVAADPKTFRFLRYLSPTGSYGNVAEIEFYTGVGTSVVKLTGTPFGTAGSYKNNGFVYTNALDGNTSTFFDAPAPGNGDYLGIDQGPPVGSLSGSSAAITVSQPINLTTLGTTDWAHWGLNGVHGSTPGEFDHKAGLISNYTAIGTGTVVSYPTTFINCTWTGGTPTASATTSSEVYLKNNGSGFNLTVPADTTRRTLTLYVGGYNSTATLTAHLSDGSAVDFVDASYGYNKVGNTDGAHYQGAYTLTYSASSAGQKLTVSWVQTSSAASGGNVALQAAALALTPP